MATGTAGNTRSITTYYFLPVQLYLIKLQQLELVVPKSILNSLHQGENLLLFQTTSNDLHAHGKAVHGTGVIMLVGALCNTIQLADAKVSGKLVLVSVDMRYGDDAGGVIELSGFVRQ